MKNYVLYFVSPQQVNILEESIPVPKSDEVLIKNVRSGISAGTEKLIYSGLVPVDLPLDTEIPSLRQSVDYPFKYGYCSIGKVMDVGSKTFENLLGRQVFVFNPHESYFCAKEDQLILLPEDISTDDALFIPNMETAINLVLDSAPLIGENVLILGLGILGLLTSALLQKFPLTTLIGIDLYEKRRAISLELGTKLTFDPSQNDLNLEIKRSLNRLSHQEIDLIYELTGNPEALNSAISLISYEGRIVLGSWYGNKTANINLGGKFHRNRIKLISSQVSSLASELKGRWNKVRRFGVMFEMLRAIRPSRFVSHQFHITESAKAYQLLQNDPQNVLQIALTYEE